ncbi:MAG TPA: ABC transporter ATP-binding protein [Bacteroidota bacterium]|nr:ABC transporter ATP-binding protein [Bacteroidota bacterium]
MASDVIVRTHNLGKRYKNRWAVEDVNLEIYRGDIFGFLGPNGAGKSTTIRMILSLIQPTAGSVELFGHQLRTEREKALAKVAGIVEKPDFYLYLTAIRNMEIAGSLTLGKTPDRKAIASALGLVGLGERANDRVKTFSHGMKQRLGIAQALLCEPDLIVLDEPTNGLDPQGMKEVRELVVRLSKERGMTVFLSSHLLNEVEQVATRMAIINKGTLVVQGNVDELVRNSTKNILLDARPQKKALAVMRKMKLVKNPLPDGEGITAEIESPQIPSVVAGLVRAGCKVYGVKQERSLEEYFLSVTESEGGSPKPNPRTTP